MEYSYIWGAPKDKIWAPLEGVEICPICLEVNCSIDTTGLKNKRYFHKTKTIHDYSSGPIYRKPEPGPEDWTTKQYEDRTTKESDIIARRLALVVNRYCLGASDESFEEMEQLVIQWNRLIEEGR